MLINLSGKHFIHFVKMRRLDSQNSKLLFKFCSSKWNSIEIEVNMCLIFQGDEQQKTKPGDIMR